MSEIEGVADRLSQGRGLTIRQATEMFNGKLLKVLK